LALRIIKLCIILALVKSGILLANFDSTHIYQELSKPDTTWKYEYKNALETAPKLLLNFYQNNISNLETHHCPMEPSCSEFSRLAFEKTSFLKALFLTADRLMRDNSLSKKKYRRNERDKLIDPIERYISWPDSLQ